MITAKTFPQVLVSELVPAVMALVLVLVLVKQIRMS